MIFLAAFLLIISAVNPFTNDSRDCFEHSERDCMENFVDIAFFGPRNADECSELQKLLNCSAVASDECFGVGVGECFGVSCDWSANIKMEEYENLYKDNCGAVSRDNSSDFDPKECFNKRKEICWDTFENAVFQSVFYSRNYSYTDKCSVLRLFILCTRQAADDCYKNEYDEEAEKFLKVWEKKLKLSCMEDVRCHVNEWSQWSPCSVTSGTGHTIRTRRYKRIESHEQLDMCNLIMKMEQVAPCSAECSDNLRISDASSSNSKKCFEEKTKICKDDLFEDIYYDYFSSSYTTEYTCSQIRRMLGCSSRAAVNCFQDRHDEKVEEVHKEFENKFNRLCYDIRWSDRSNEFEEQHARNALLMDMLSTDYYRREKCIDENKDYIFQCTRHVIADASLCLIWKHIMECMKRRVGEKCDEEATWKFEKLLPEERTKEVCKNFNPFSNDEYAA